MARQMDNGKHSEEQEAASRTGERDGAQPRLEFATPILPVRKGILTVPVVGIIDADRARDLAEQILRSIHQRRARAVVIDLTGVPAIDARTANALVQISDAAGLLGAKVIATGISRVVAQTLVEIGADLSRIITRADLESGLDEASHLIEERPQSR